MVTITHIKDNEKIIKHDKKNHENHKSNKNNANNNNEYNRRKQTEEHLDSLYTQITVDSESLNTPLTPAADIKTTLVAGKIFPLVFGPPEGRRHSRLRLTYRNIATFYNLYMKNVYHDLPARYESRLAGRGGGYAETDWLPVLPPPGVDSTDVCYGHLYYSRLVIDYYEELAEVMRERESTRGNGLRIQG